LNKYSVLRTSDILNYIKNATDYEKVHQAIKAYSIIGSDKFVTLNNQVEDILRGGASIVSKYLNNMNKQDVKVADKQEVKVADKQEVKVVNKQGVKVASAKRSRVSKVSNNLSNPTPKDVNNGSESVTLNVIGVSYAIPTFGTNSTDMNDFNIINNTANIVDITDIDENTVNVANNSNMNTANNGHANGGNVSNIDDNSTGNNNEDDKHSVNSEMINYGGTLITKKAYALIKDIKFDNNDDDNDIDDDDISI
jgi:hypothetical protein